MSQAGEAHAPDLRGGLEASQYAPGNGRRQEPREVRAEPDKQQDLKNIAKDILIAKKGLKEEGVESSWLITLEELAARVTHASRTRYAPPGGVEARLGAIKKALKTLTGTDNGRKTT